MSTHPLSPFCVAGYRCFKAIMFLSGLLFGSVIIFLLCYKERVVDTQLSVEASAGIGLGIGLLCGLVTMMVRSVGLFMTGILLGLLLAIAGLLLTHQLYTPSTLWVRIQDQIFIIFSNAVLLHRDDFIINSLFILCSETHFYTL